MSLRSRLIEAMCEAALKRMGKEEHTLKEWMMAEKVMVPALDAFLDVLEVAPPGFAYDVGQRVWGGFGDTPERFRDEAHENIEALIHILRGGDG